MSVTDLDEEVPEYDDEEGDGDREEYLSDPRHLNIEEVEEDDE
jgi:hypothetical protein